MKKLATTFVVLSTLVLIAVAAQVAVAKDTAMSDKEILRQVEYLLAKEKSAFSAPAQATSCNDCEPADLDGDGVVGTNDLVALLAAWGDVDCAFCEDSDGGINPFVQGTLDNETGSFTDYCFGNTVIEYYCNGDASFQEIISCTDFGMICSNGACIPDNGSGNETNTTMPDLIVTAYDYVIENGSNGTNMSVGYTITIQNVGDAAATASTAQVFFDGSNDFVQNKATPALAPNQSVTLNGIIGIDSGTYNLSITADVFDVVDESDETNNVLVDVFVVP